MNWLAIITLWIFLISSLVFVVGLVIWLITMARDKNPKRPRQVTLAAFGIALAALMTNAFI
ncbi:hypothetical protein [Lacticaseibacillus brantae]|uniref:Uncharacterized protein n=1 Tax=Lacticaseibacillus brantae DSM 23927 TaxID=1423727 RepID=A0A0R2B7Z7_9LACO|nr:hypothetical protein [Lacticaseibacillus brantae]KRM72473.1 hypothetical protein FC34_GL000178 [Lacticaseibacillus brantae DSM 23927]